MTTENTDLLKANEERKARIRQEAVNFISQFKTLQSWTPAADPWTRGPEEIIAEVQKIYPIDAYTTPDERVNQLRWLAMTSGTHEDSPIYNHLPTVIEAYRRNELAIAEEDRKLTLPTQLEIFSLGLSAEMFGRVRDSIFWINPKLRDAIESPNVHFGEGARSEIALNERGDLTIRTAQTRPNADHTAPEEIQGSEQIHNLGNIASWGLGIDNNLVQQSHADLQHNLAQAYLLSQLIGRANWLRHSLLEKQIKF